MKDIWKTLFMNVSSQRKIHLRSKIKNWSVTIELSLIKKADNDPTIYIKGIKLYILPNADKFDGNAFVYGLIQHDLI